METRRMCPNCRAFITTNDKICPYCDAQVGVRAVERRAPADVLGGLIPHTHFTTVLILLINVGLYLAMVSRSGGDLNGNGFSNRIFYDFGAKTPLFWQRGEWWRLITAGFLHGGLFHIAMNSWVLYDIGAHVEETYGTARYLTIYFVSTITGFLLSAWWRPFGISVGASAGLFGLIGAMIVFGVRDRSSYGAAVKSMYMRSALFTLMIGLMPFFPIDNAAHIGGLAGGLAIGYIAGTPRLQGFQEKIWQSAALVALLLTAGAFAIMFRHLTSGT